MAGRVIGIDFGTTNSLVSQIDPVTEQVRNYLNQDDERPHPSTVWFRGGEIKVGREARSFLDGGDEAVSGDFIRSPKRLLIAQNSVAVGSAMLDPREVVAHVLKFLRADAADPRREAGRIEIDRAVMTIPVRLDGLGRRALRDAARLSNIKVEHFVHEPLAALYAYLRSRPDFHRRLAELEGRRILVFDWGGGTLDLTLCLIRGGKLIQIANDGDNGVGGDLFDDAIRVGVRERHAAANGLENVTSLENDGAGVRLLQTCESAKIRLSTEETFTVFLRNYLRAETGRDLRMVIKRTDVDAWTESLVNRGLSLVDRLLAKAGISANEVELCLPTGGMVSVPTIREGLVRRFRGRVENLQNADTIIAEGAAWIAHDRLRLTLAKPFEMTAPFGNHIELVSANQELPILGQQIMALKSKFYCTDPRDGIAILQFARPVKPDQFGPGDLRQPYGILRYPVSTVLPPFAEKLDVEILIDHDYVVKVTVGSSVQDQSMRTECEIHDLEFALWIRGSSSKRENASTPEKSQRPASTSGITQAANVQIRTNTYNKPNSWGVVSGDLVEKYRERWFDTQGNSPSKEQLAEKVAHTACAICYRLESVFMIEGCAACKIGARTVHRSAPSYSSTATSGVTSMDAG